MSYNEEKQQDKSMDEEEERGARPRVVRESPELPTEFRRFARCLAETEPPPDAILQTGQRGPERLDRVYYNLERILDTIGGFDKKRAEVEKKIQLKEEEEQRKEAQSEYYRKPIFTDLVRLLAPDNNTPSKKAPKEPHPSPSRPMNQRREDLFESSQREVYYPANATVHPRVQHSEDLNSTNLNHRMFDDMSYIPFHTNWGRSPVDDRPSSPYAFRRRRPNVLDREGPTEIPPAEQSSRAALLAALEVPIEDITRTPSRQILQNLRNIVAHEIRCMEFRNRRMGASDPPISTTRVLIRPRLQRRPANLFREHREEDERGDASMQIPRRRRRPDIVTAVVIPAEIPTQRSENLQSMMQQLLQTRKQISILQSQTENLALVQSQSQQQQQQQQESAKNRNRSAQKLNKDKTQTKSKDQTQLKTKDKLQPKLSRQEANKTDQPQQKIQKQPSTEAKPQPRTKAQRDTSVCAMDESDSFINNDSYLAFDQETYQEEELEVTLLEDRSIVEVNSLENSLSITTVASGSLIGSGNDVPKNVPDSTCQFEKLKFNVPQASSSKQMPKQDSSRPKFSETCNNEACHRRMSILQNNIEQLERDFLQATHDCQENSALECLHEAWQRLAKHWERLENARSGLTDMDAADATHETYRDDRAVLLLQHRALEEHCLFNDRRLTRALRDASEAQRRVASLEGEIALLREQQELQLQGWEDRLEDALRENRLLSGAMEKLKNMEN